MSAVQLGPVGASALFGLAPPAEGDIPIVPVMPVRAGSDLGWALRAGALVLGGGALPGSYVVRGTRATLLGPAVGTMDQSTQQNAAMVEETSAVARNLDGEVGALTQASRFRVGGGDARRATPTTASTVARRLEPAA